MSADPGQPAARAGLTLIEVLVALSIAGLVMLGARMLLAHLADSTDRLVQEATRLDEEVNAERLLRRLLAQVEASDGDSTRFIGDGRAARFVTWCDVPAGWQERCTVDLGLVPMKNGLALAVVLPGADPIVTHSGIDSGGLRYLYTAANGGTWLPAWESIITTPLAVGVVMDSDTLVLRIGERG